MDGFQRNLYLRISSAPLPMYACLSPTCHSDTSELMALLRSTSPLVPRLPGLEAARGLARPQLILDFLDSGLGIVQCWMCCVLNFRIGKDFTS